MAAEIVETRRVFARGVAAIESRWIEAHAQHLVRRRSSDPIWSIKRGEVVAFERVTLYGLVLAGAAASGLLLGGSRLLP